jgi:hypothetical protein
MTLSNEFTLPEHPALAAWASALNDSGHWAQILDRGFCYV